MKSMQLTIESLKREAARFARFPFDSDGALYGGNDGKTIGTFIEKTFKHHLNKEYEFGKVDLSVGIDFPEINVDVKTSKVNQPQSSCPFRTAEQKIFGLGYSLLVFLYDKTDDERTRTTKLNITIAIFIEKDVTGDYMTTKGLLELLDRGANVDDIEGFLYDRNLPIDEIGARRLAEKILDHSPKQGCLTISNALQWRLQFGRAVSLANDFVGIEEL